MSGEAPRDLDARREETLGAISQAADMSALEEVRVRTLGTEVISVFPAAA